MKKHLEIIIAIAVFINITCCHIFFILRTATVIMIYKVLSGIIRWININHLHLTEIRLLE